MSDAESNSCVSLFSLNSCVSLFSLTLAYAMGLADDVKDLDWVVEPSVTGTPKPNRPKTNNKGQAA